MEVAGALTLVIGVLMSKKRQQVVQANDLSNLTISHSIVEKLFPG